MNKVLGNFTSRRYRSGSLTADNLCTGNAPRHRRHCRGAGIRARTPTPWWKRSSSRSTWDAKVAEAKGYTAMLGHYLLHGQEMDETIALFFRAPHSYTGEDVIELSVHGGTAMADGLLEALITAGTAPRRPGEFTRRAAGAWPACR